MGKRQIAIVGGGAAGFFAAITAAETSPDCAVTIYEATAHLLAKVKVSGGGRCNVTHACFEPRELARRYPRGGRELLGAFSRWQPRDTVEWFEGRGVKLKTEDDGRMFPVTDNSQTIIDCLMGAAQKAGVVIRTNCGMKSVERADPSALGSENALRWQGVPPQGMGRLTPSSGAASSFRGSAAPSRTRGNGYLPAPSGRTPRHPPTQPRR